MNRVGCVGSSTSRAGCHRDVQESLPVMEKWKKIINEDKNKTTVGNLLTRDHPPGDHRK